MKICICTCQFYHRIPREKIAMVQASCRVAQVQCEIIPDLCFTSAKDRNRLASLASCKFVLACQPRAVRSLLGNTVVSAKCIDLRSQSLDEIMTLLSLTPVDHLMESVNEKLVSDWMPWFPVIDMERCVQCRKCVDFCMFGVYSVESGTVQVIQPESCKTDCPACARICPQNAIIFPKSEEERVNGALSEQIRPSDSDKISFRERLQHRKGLRLFKEDTP